MGGVRSELRSDQATGALVKFDLLPRRLKYIFDKEKYAELHKFVNNGSGAAGRLPKADPYKVELVRRIDVAARWLAFED